MLQQSPQELAPSDNLRSRSGTRRSRSIHRVRAGRLGSTKPHSVVQLAAPYLLLQCISITACDAVYRQEVSLIKVLLAGATEVFLFNCQRDFLPRTGAPFHTPYDRSQLRSCQAA